MVSREMGSRPFWVILTVRREVFIWGETVVMVPWRIVPAYYSVSIGIGIGVGIGIGGWMEEGREGGGKKGKANHSSTRSSPFRWRIS